LRGKLQLLEVVTICDHLFYHPSVLQKFQGLEVRRVCFCRRSPVGRTFRSAQRRQECLRHVCLLTDIHLIKPADGDGRNRGGVAGEGDVGF
jgi:hypothetical protein